MKVLFCNYYLSGSDLEFGQEISNEIRMFFKVCKSNQFDVLNTQQMWTAPRPNVQKILISRMSAKFDRDRNVDRRRVNALTAEFDRWYKNSAKFDFGLSAFGRGLNVTLPDDFLDLLTF